MNETDIEAFITRWGGGSSRGGNERANLQLFLTEFCTLLDLPQPDPASADNSQNAYVFERSVTERLPDGSTKPRSLDLYKRGCFVLEGKDTGKQTGSDTWDAAIVKAHKQAENYVRALPAEEGRPPFILVVDVGRSFVLYSEFTCSGGNYVPFPDARGYRIRLEQLRAEDIRERLRALWLDPLSLDSSRHAGRVTRQIADALAGLAKSLEETGADSERVAGFLSRCLFTMFAEDVGLLPAESFSELLARLQQKPEAFPDALKSLWQSMNSGGFCGVLMTQVLRFNGGLFEGADPLPLTAKQIGQLIDAARADWRQVEPAIFGTLLERALNPHERHKLGAHYTPRAYVERLVMPTVIEPLRADWEDVQVAAQNHARLGKTKDAITEVRNFHGRLCQTRVLDPACGSGNFLYVALEHMKRLEGEVLDVLGRLQKSASFELEGFTVNPNQFLGLEINPRAARIADIVLWIGYLQWHFRTYGHVNPPEPVLRDFHNIQCRDALIEAKAREPLLDDQGQPVTVWDGRSVKVSPITGEKIPDEAQRLQVYRYLEPCRAEWPEADFIVGNPPFIGAASMRRALGDGYVDAVRKVYSGLVPDSADFVMYWWQIAAEKVRKGGARRFGFITTNSLRQTFNRRVLEPHLNDPKTPLSLVFAVPDHPWVEASDGAQVRIAMTVGAPGQKPGLLQQVVSEHAGDDDARAVSVTTREGKLFADLVIGANVSSAETLQSNNGISFRGVSLIGAFDLTQDEANRFGFDNSAVADSRIRPFVNGKDIAQSPSNRYVIDLFGLDLHEVRQSYPALYQWVLERVKPSRDAKSHTKDGAAYAKSWWVFGKPRQEMRRALENLDQFFVTPMTAKHRLIVRMGQPVLPDQGLIVFSTCDQSHQGILSSRIHCAWALATGGRLGVGNDPRYNNSRCFETFPFPAADDTQIATIRDLAEQIDTHRKRQQAKHPKLTLTGIYNVLDAQRHQTPLTEKDQAISNQGLVTLLRELHDQLDTAVFEAYGWQDLAKQLIGRPGATCPWPDKPADQLQAEEELLTRLVALNAERAAEEAQGSIRWLRPDYQNPQAHATTTGEQQTADLDTPATATTTAKPKKGKIKFPTARAGIPEQVAVVKSALGKQARSLEELTEEFSDPKRTAPKIAEILATLESLGLLQREGERYRLTR
ncbi:MULTISPECIES: class I SAM-dependent DNA methyltransferase [Thiorhodovibrio]|uniref:class I SAM-dependent DNA methyltransferase n=1 Tax=Thiorhodovibrio TaxID=61593 RepID=UPI0019136D9E|nr:MULTISPECIES: class I SAM-dependent DNA methyltransferase [Thiorhodovibrio]MBK5969911.1 SAM-dependent methyltransferase [Thiorhodovibrio winogradskyi]WPL12044.1 Type I restriction-modification system methyltransferase subunit [Thiorhodovibrio litoralis]